MDKAKARINAIGAQLNQEADVESSISKAAPLENTSADGASNDHKRTAKSRRVERNSWAVRPLNTSVSLNNDVTVSNLPTSRM